MRSIAVPWMRAYNPILLFIYKFDERRWGSVAAFKIP